MDGGEIVLFTITSSSSGSVSSYCSPVVLLPVLLQSSVLGTPPHSEMTSLFSTSSKSEKCKEKDNESYVTATQSSSSSSSLEASSGESTSRKSFAELVNCLYHLVML